MSKILIIAEHDEKNLNASTLKCAKCAQAIGGETDIVILGSQVQEIAKQASAIDGISTVYAVAASHLEAPLAVNWASEIVAMANGYTHILGPSTTFGRDLMPRIAALLGVNQVSDIIAVKGSHHFKRPVYAGNAIVDVQADEGVVLVGTVRTASWPDAEAGGSAAIQTRDAASAAAEHTRFVALESAAAERPDLQTAKIVISGGRALAIWGL